MDEIWHENNILTAVIYAEKKLNPKVGIVLHGKDQTMLRKRKLDEISRTYSRNQPAYKRYREYAGSYQSGRGRGGFRGFSSRGRGYNNRGRGYNNRGRGYNNTGRGRGRGGRGYDNSSGNRGGSNGNYTARGRAMMQTRYSGRGRGRGYSQRSGFGANYL